MALDDAQNAKLRDAKRRAGWTMPLEHYYPPGALAEAFPDRYGHLAARGQPSQEVSEMAPAEPAKAVSYTVEPITGSCDVIRPRFCRP